MKTCYLSQREAVDEQLSELLATMKYPDSEDFRNGLLDIINLLSDYHEEGTALFPDVLVVDSEEYFKTFKCERMVIKKSSLERHEFSQCIKMCAPLAVNGWSVYIIVNGNDGIVEYGILTTEVKILSLNLYEQTMTAGIPEINCLFIRNVGNKVVEVRDVQTQMFVVLNLSDESIFAEGNINSLVEDIFYEQDNEHREVKNFLKKTIQQALNEGHGNLMAVVHDEDASIKATLDNLHDGITLEQPMDFRMLTDEYHQYNNEETSVKLRSYANLMQSMLNFDGITLFTDKGRVLGYHYIVNNNAVKAVNQQGGSRTRAFLALKEMECVKSCFMKSQDGRIKYYRR